MKASFKATTPGGVDIFWNERRGFSGPMGSFLNHELKTATGQTHTPKAILARRVLLEMLPGCVIANFVSFPLEPVTPGALS